jgi:hypothetical protein
MPVHMRILPPVTCVEKSEFFLTLSHSIAVYNAFSFSSVFKCVIVFSSLDSMLQFLEKSLIYQRFFGLELIPIRIGKVPYVLDADPDSDPGK